MRLPSSGNLIRKVQQCNYLYMSWSRPMVSYSPDIDHYLTTREVATRLRISDKTLRNWRWKGDTKLPWRTFGSAVRYWLPDVIAFEEGCRA